MFSYVKKTYIISLCFPLLLASNSIFAQGDSLVWSDEFEGSEVKMDNWSFQIGDGTSEGIPGWGNNELEYYRAENATVDNGYLIITAKKENYGGKNYTSARLRTIHKADFLYGKFEARMKLPRGQGMWTAFWMLSTDQVYGGWAASGEIDIMEAINIPTEVRGTIHYGGEWPENVESGAGYTDGDTDFSEDFHIYTFEWRPTVLKWYVDGNHFSTKTSWWSSGGDYPAPFDKSFHLIVNLAVGGNWPGAPNETTEFPQYLFVDWIRVYELEDETGIKRSDNLKVFHNCFVLKQNYPNPFNPTTNIEFELPKASNVTLKIFTILGEEVATLVSDKLSSGSYSYLWNAGDLASGVYLYRLSIGSPSPKSGHFAAEEAEGFVQTRKLILLK